MRKVKWSFDDEIAYEGMTDDSRWNGFLNVWISPEVRAQVVKDIREANKRYGFTDEDSGVNDIEQLPVGADGLVCLGWGYATSEV